MKHSLLFLSLLSLLFLGSCASDDALTEQTQDPEPDVPTIPFTGTITTGNGPSAVAQALTADDGPFHALSDEGTTLKATWEVGDELALIVNGTLCKATVSEVTGNKAYISASVPATVSDGAEARLIYPYTAVNESTLEVKAGLLSEQDGTLATIAKELDVCKGSGTLSVANNTAKLKADVTMLEQYCIWRFATQCNGSALPIDQLTIKQGDEVYYSIYLPSSGTSSGIYVVLSPSSAAEYTFTAAPIQSLCAEDNIVLTKTVSNLSLAAQKFYRSTLNFEVEVFTFSHYTWDAKQWYWYPQSMTPSSSTTYPTVNEERRNGYPTDADPDRWYNTIYGGTDAYKANNSACRADGSARNMPCFNAMTWYLSDDVYWDEGNAWILGGLFYNSGLWVKRWDKISGKPSGASITSCSSASTTTVRRSTVGRPSNTADYFFLPALGRYQQDGMLYGLGSEGYYWPSSPSHMLGNATCVLFFYGYDSFLSWGTQFSRDYGYVAGSRPGGIPWFQ